jgi:hypothetical protein
LLGFASIKPDTFTICAAINDEIAPVGDFFHSGVAFRTFHSVFNRVRLLV